MSRKRMKDISIHLGWEQYEKRNNGTLTRIRLEDCGGHWQIYHWEGEIFFLRGSMQKGPAREPNYRKFERALEVIGDPPEEVIGDPSDLDMW